MSINIISKFVKSKYKKCNDILYLVVDCVTLGIELVLCFIMLINRFTNNSEIIINLMLYLTLGVAYFYVIFETIYIKYKQKKLQLNLKQQHHNYIKRSFLALIIVTGIIIVLIILAINKGKIYSNENNFGIYIWCMAMIGLAWTDGYYIKSVVLFGSDCYYSGKYNIKYNSINKIKKISKHIAGFGLYEIYLIEIYSKDNLIGIDKLFSDEYNFLLNKISND